MVSLRDVQTVRPRWGAPPVKAIRRLAVYVWKMLCARRRRVSRGSTTSRSSSTRDSPGILGRPSRWARRRGCVGRRSGGERKTDPEAEKERDSPKKGRSQSAAAKSSASSSHPVGTRDARGKTKKSVGQTSADKTWTGRGRRGVGNANDPRAHFFEHSDHALALRGASRAGTGGSGMGSSGSCGRLQPSAPSPQAANHVSAGRTTHLRKTDGSREWWKMCEMDGVKCSVKEWWIWNT